MSRQTEDDNGGGAMAVIKKRRAIGIVTALVGLTDAFLSRGGKLILYHGLSDSGPPWPYTYDYFRAVEKDHGGGYAGVSEFMKMYLVPNMGHCGGNASTDRFDMLTPMV